MKSSKFVLMLLYDFGLIIVRVGLKIRLCMGNEGL